MSSTAFDAVPKATEVTHSPLLLAANISRFIRLSPESEPLCLLDQVSLEVAQGETLALVGASGAGKSTLLGLLAGLDTPDAGEIRLAGQAFSQADEDTRAQLRAHYMSFVFQSFQLLPELTALENVQLPLEVSGQTQAQEVAQHWLAQVGLQARMHHRPHQLSGGEQQRVAIARAFVTHPQILFADEPTGSLDAVTGRQIIDLLFQLNQEAHTTLILVTHDRGLAQECQRRIKLEAGRILPE